MIFGRADVALLSSVHSDNQHLLTQKGPGVVVPTGRFPDGLRLHPHGSRERIEIFFVFFWSGPRHSQITIFNAWPRCEATTIDWPSLPTALLGIVFRRRHTTETGLFVLFGSLCETAHAVDMAFLISCSCEVWGNVHRPPASSTPDLPEMCLCSGGSGRVTNRPKKRSVVGLAP